MIHFSVSYFSFICLSHSCKLSFPLTSSLPPFSFPDCLSLGHTSCSLAYCVALYAAVGFSLPLSFPLFLPFILLNAPWHYFGVVLPTWQSPGATLRADTREHVPTDTSTCGCYLRNVLQWFVLSLWVEFVVYGTWYPFARVVLFEALLEHFLLQLMLISLIKWNFRTVAWIACEF